MGVTVSHVLSATTPDDPAYEIQVKHWNSNHAVTLNVAATEISGLFSNKNGVSFGLDGTNITGSIAAGVPSPVNFSAGTTSSDLGSVVFSNANGISFGLSGSTITGTVGTNYAGVGETVGTTAGSDLALTVNTDGVSIGYPKWITTAMASNRGTDFVQATAAFAGTNASGTINSTGISVSVGPYITTAMLSNRGSDFVQATAAFAGTSASGTINSTGISVSIGPYITTADLSANSSKYVQNWKLTGNTLGTTSSAQGTDLWFQGGNSLTVSGSSNSIVFSVGNYLTTARASTDAIGLNTAQTNVTWTVNSSGLSLNASGYAGTGTTFAGANISGSMTQNSAGINLSLSAAAGGGGTTISTYEPYPIVNTATVGVQFDSNTSAMQSLWPFIVDAPVAAEYIKLALTMSFVTGGTSSFRQSGTWHWGLFTRPTGANNTRLSGGTTGTLTFALTYNNSTISISQATTTSSTGYGYLQTSSAGLNITSGYTGLKMFDLYLGATLTPGHYWFGIHHRNSSTSFNSGLRYSVIGIQNTLSGMAPMGSFSSDYNTGTKIPLNIGGHWLMGNAIYSVAGQTQLTTDITMSQMTLDRTFVPYMKFESRV